MEEQEDITRGVMHMQAWLLSPLTGASPISDTQVTRVTLILEYDYKGRLPRFTYK